MTENKLAAELASNLDRRLELKHSLPEPTPSSDQPLLELAEYLTFHSPFAPTPAEHAVLRARLGRLVASEQKVTGRRLFFPALKPALQAVFWAIVLFGVVVVSISLITHLLGQPSRPTPAGPRLAPTEPTATPTATTSLSANPVFPAQIQVHGGISVELREVIAIGDSLRATLCYQPLEGKAMRLDGVEIALGVVAVPFFPSSFARSSVGADGLACETFTAQNQGSEIAGDWTITAHRLVSPRENSPNCEEINQQLAGEIPGLAIRCETSGGAFGFTMSDPPAGVNRSEAQRLVQIYLESDVRAGPWVFTIDKADIVQSTSGGASPDLVVVPSACDPTSDLLAAEQPSALSDFYSSLSGIAGSGAAKSGDFTFRMGLACDPTLSRLSPRGYRYSEVSGLGILWQITYHGQPVSGETSYYSGFEPFIEPSGMTGSLMGNEKIEEVEGILFPENILPDFTQSDVRLRFQLKIQAPGKEIQGASLSFTLQREPEGYRPVNVQVEPLPEAELRTIQGDPSAPLPFPTRPAPERQVFEQTQALLDLLERWQEPFLASPGWIHQRTRIEIPGGTHLYAGLTEYTADDWYQIDEQGLVIAIIHIEQRLDGTPLQQVVSRDGTSTNLTFGMSGEYEPYPLDLAYAVKDPLLSSAAYQQSEITFSGRSAILLAMPDLVTYRHAIDQASGALLYTEIVHLQAGEDPLTGGNLDTRTTVEVVERVNAPPGEALALLSQKFEGYTPAEPYGTPPPPGFDPTNRALTIQSIMGDSFDSPSFWYGDIYAGGYLLGRINFGSTPGGDSCDRSPDGAMLAFARTTVIESGYVSSMALTWFDLRDIQNIHQPAPELVNIGELAWSPAANVLAVFGCQANQQACGLYLFDPDSPQLRLLLPGVYTYWQPLWKPDGSQIAFIDNLQEGNTLYVVDVRAGRVIYQGAFDAQAWKVPAGSPTIQWGLNFPRGMSGSRCFSSN